jgi:hypothetical protein
MGRDYIGFKYSNNNGGNINLFPGVKHGGALT